MTQWVKVIITMARNLDLIPGIHEGEGTELTLESLPLTSTCML